MGSVLLVLFLGSFASAQRSSNTGFEFGVFGSCSVRFPSLVIPTKRRLYRDHRFCEVNSHYA